MKKIAAVLLACLLLTMTASAREFEEPDVIRCICYCIHGRTASGCDTRYGIVSGKKEWIGSVAELHQVNEDGSIGPFIGYFEFKDTGAGFDTDGDGIGDSIPSGESIDVWVDCKDEAYMWSDAFGNYVYMKIINGKG